MGRPYTKQKTVKGGAGRVGNPPPTAAIGRAAKRPADGPEGQPNGRTYERRRTIGAAARGIRRR